MTTKEVILNVKQLYDEAGLDGFESLFKPMFKKNNTKKVADLICWITQLFYKMDTCTSDCFDNLKEKVYCDCPCNDDPMFVSFSQDETPGVS